MNLKVKIDKYGNLINLDTNAIIVPSNESFIDNFWETDGTIWKVNTTTQVTASTDDTMSVVVPTGEFTQNSRVDFYFRLHLPILDYDKKVNIFEFSTGTSSGYDISFYKPSTYDNYFIYVKGAKQILPISSTESLDIVGILSMCNIGSNTLAVFITLYTNENGTLTKVAENAYSGFGGNVLYFGVSRDYHTNLSSYMVEGIAFDEDIIINPNNNNPIIGIIKYLNDIGLNEVWANIKNYVTAQLLGKSNTGHTHVKSEITDFPTIPTKTSDLTNDSGFLTDVAWNDVTNKPSFATVATSGSYNDLTDKPVIPNVSNYYTKEEVDALIAGISPSTNTLFIGEPYSLANSAETNLGNYEEVNND